MDTKSAQSSQFAARKRVSDKGLLLAEALQLVAAHKDELRSAVRFAYSVGITEVEIGRLAGISRPTVRDWLGKKT